MKQRLGTVCVYRKVWYFTVFVCVNAVKESQPVMFSRLCLVFLSVFKKEIAFDKFFYQSEATAVSMQLRLAVCCDLFTRFCSIYSSFPSVNGGLLNSMIGTVTVQCK